MTSYQSRAAQATLKDPKIKYIIYIRVDASTSLIRLYILLLYYSHGVTNVKVIVSVSILYKLSQTLRGSSLVTSYVYDYVERVKFLHFMSTHATSCYQKFGTRRGISVKIDQRLADSSSNL